MARAVKPSEENRRKADGRRRDGKSDRPVPTPSEIFWTVFSIVSIFGHFHSFLVEVSTLWSFPIRF